MKELTIDTILQEVLNLAPGFISTDDTGKETVEYDVGVAEYMARIELLRDKLAEKD